ncbi:hypothetical protein KUV64_10425 [Mameliella alba]|uniref:hypothetical protein n=1 Tax=Mameliella TaxID=1434019 RepID=UPI001056A76C|nr:MULTISPECIES: hypothetical protein [Mameliella]MBY6119547.1 hypothetical protein [Mameliella alba]MDD9730973.1 hypothetical protein [Mameliella sp. AT18]
MFNDTLTPVAIGSKSASSCQLQSGLRTCLFGSRGSTVIGSLRFDQKIFEVTVIEGSEPWFNILSDLESFSFMSPKGGLKPTGVLQDGSSRAVA